MNPSLKYLELKSGFNDDGPAWIGEIQFSNSGKGIYFNNMLLLGNGHGLCINVETSEEYWVTGIKKNGANRHWTGRGKIKIDKKCIAEYLSLTNAKFLDMNKFEIVEICPTNKSRFTEFLNAKL